MMSKLLTRNLWLSVSLLLLAAPFARAGSEPASIAEKYLPRLEKILTENIEPFWYNKSLDRSNGGYIISFDIQGKLKEPVVKMIVTQARQVWLFSRLARAGYEPQKHLEAARLGYQFLRDKMWDRTNGGFYWEVDITGNQKLKPDKHLYGQSFALYAISEYAMASGDKEALAFAVQLFDLLEEKSHDAVHGGYIEYFSPDWTSPPAGQSYMGAPGDMKLMNTHLHLLEAMTTFYRTSQLPLARERLLELINIESNTVVRKNIGACTDKYSQDWTPQLDTSYARVSYGHDIENVWLLMDACDAAGVSNYPFMDLYQTLFKYSLQYGYDARNGGFFNAGRFNSAADDRGKTWWVEAEAIVSSLRMYRCTRDAKYLSAFDSTLNLIESKFVDWEVGEWFEAVPVQGQPQGDKGSVWKAGYHDGRAMIECIEILKAWKD